MAFDFPVSNPFRRKPPSQKSIAAPMGTAATQAPAKAPPVVKPTKRSAKQRAEKWLNNIMKSAKSPAKSRAAQTVAQGVTPPAPLDSAQYLQALQAMALDPRGDQATFSEGPPANVQAYVDALRGHEPAGHSPIGNNAQQTAPSYVALPNAESYAAALSNPDQPTNVDPVLPLQQQFVAHTAPTGPATAPDAHLSGKVADVKQAMRLLEADMEKRGQTEQTLVLKDGSKLFASFLFKDNKKTGVFVVEDLEGRDSAGYLGQWASLNGDSLWLNRGFKAGAIDGKAPDSLADHVNPSCALDEALANAKHLLQRPDAAAQPISKAVNA